ncbi:MAG: HD domain-containing protein [Dehalococcoidales bacterium]|nr:HD domain-containing protein [Dehalococcoidales bacterium]
MKRPDTPKKRAKTLSSLKATFPVDLPPAQEDDKKKLELLYRVGRKIGSAADISRLLDQILRMTQQALQASASSVLLLDRNRKDLYFQTVEGQAKSKVQQVRLDLNSGIAGWVARHASPLIINDVNKDHRFHKGVDKSTGFVTKAILAVPLVWGQEVIGVLEVLNKTDGSSFNAQDLQVSMTLAAIAASAISNARLHQAVLDGYKSTVKVLTAAIDARDPYTCGHSQRVMEYTMMGAAQFSFSPEEMQTIEFGSLLHDVGKIGIYDSILRKPDYLTSDEWAMMRKHPLIGARILGEIPFLEKARDLVLHHHERYDGTGYPEGLKGEAITKGARLLAVADAFDTMTTDRSYRAALGVDIALNELNKFAGTQFCPIAVAAFTRAFAEHGLRTGLTDKSLENLMPTARIAVRL